MNLEALSDHIVSLNLGVPGQTLFLHEMPADCHRGILLRLPLIGISVDHELPKYFRGEFQAIVRDKSHSSGAQLAQDLFDAFTLGKMTLLNQTGQGMRFNHLHPKTLPIKYRRSDGNGIEWSINFTGSYVTIDT